MDSQFFAVANSISIPTSGLPVLGGTSVSPSHSAGHSFQNLSYLDGGPYLFSTPVPASSAVSLQLGDPLASCEGDGPGFCGFRSESSLLSTISLQQLQAQDLLVRLSLIQDQLRVARTSLQQYKQRARQLRYHILPRYRSSLAEESQGSHVVNSESSVLGGEVVSVVAPGVARRMHTRSQGAVHKGFSRVSGVLEWEALIVLL